MDKAEIKKMLDNHQHWLREDCDGWANMRANLYGANLRGADLRGTNLYGADLRRTNLYGADLCGANLCGADLRRTNLYGADLCGANLCGANLYGANLYGANLYGANLRGADLYGADLRGAKNAPFVPMACPDVGAFTAWKKDSSKKKIIKLLIPENAKRLSGTGRKCRADKAVVLAIENFDGSIAEEREVFSHYDREFVYHVGDTVTPKEPFCDDRWNECSSGIHFFVNREEAVQYD